MTHEVFDKITEGLKNPSRIKIVTCEDYDFLMSAENTNDTMDWFKINASKLEENLVFEGLTYIYVIETVPNNRPFIYMFIGEFITKFFVKEIVDRLMTDAPEGREAIIHRGHFTGVDIDKYDGSRSVLQDLFTMKAADVLEVLEP